MKKNYFYTNIQDQFSLLLRAARSSDPEEIRRLHSSCESRRRSLCRRLLKDFITPVAREDLYGISSRISEVFPTLIPLGAGEREISERSVLLLSADPFRFDESAVRFRDGLADLWGDLSLRSPAGRECYSALDLLAESLFVTALKNV